MKKSSVTTLAWDILTVHFLRLRRVWIKKYSLRCLAKILKTFKLLCSAISICKTLLTDFLCLNLKSRQLGLYDMHPPLPPNTSSRPYRKLGVVSLGSYDDFEWKRRRFTEEATKAMNSNSEVSKYSRGMCQMFLIESLSWVMRRLCPCPLFPPLIAKKAHLCAVWEPLFFRTHEKDQDTLLKIYKLGIVCLKHLMTVSTRGRKMQGHYLKSVDAGEMALFSSKSLNLKLYFYRRPHCQIWRIYIFSNQSGSLRTKSG